jgi:hypothetical protein
VRVTDAVFQALDIQPVIAEALDRASSPGRCRTRCPGSSRTGGEGVRERGFQILGPPNLRTRRSGRPMAKGRISRQRQGLLNLLPLSTRSADPGPRHRPRRSGPADDRGRRRCRDDCRAQLPATISQTAWVDRRTTHQLQALRKVGCSSAASCCSRCCCWCPGQGDLGLPSKVGRSATRRGGRRRPGGRATPRDQAGNQVVADGAATISGVRCW